MMPEINHGIVDCKTVGKISGRLQHGRKKGAGYAYLTIEFILGFGDPTFKWQFVF